MSLEGYIKINTIIDEELDSFVIINNVCCIDNDDCTQKEPISNTILEDKHKQLLEAYQEINLAKQDTKIALALQELALAETKACEEDLTERIIELENNIEEVVKKSSILETNLKTQIKNLQNEIDIVYDANNQWSNYGEKLLATKKKLKYTINSIIQENNLLKSQITNSQITNSQINNSQITNSQFTNS